MKKLLISLIILSSLLCHLNAQVIFQASAKKVAALTEQITLEFTVNANFSEFKAPDLSGFKVISGPSKSTSTSYTFINGKTTQSELYSYSYRIVGKRKGTFNIGKASVKIRDTIYYSNPITIKFVDSVVLPRDTTFLKVILDKDKVMLGEKIKLMLNIYTSDQIIGLNDYNFPKYRGFWVNQIQDTMPISMQQELMDSITYQKGTLQKLILIPLQSGDIEIEPFEIECNIRKQDNSDKNFYGLLDNAEIINIKSSPFTIKVSPLPENKPESFTGAVGRDFRIDASVNNNDLKCNDTILLKLQIKGNGNLKVLDKPKLSFPASLDVFEPKVKFSINKNFSDSIDSVIYEYKIIPRIAGNYTIPPIQFSYFDITSGQYNILTTNSIDINARQGKESNNNNIKNQGNKNKIVIGTDLVLLFDISGSMMAMDFDPNRLTASKKAAIEFIKQNKENRIGIVVFAGRSYSISSLTKNQSSLIYLVNKIDTGMVEVGTAIGIGVATAINQLKESKASNKIIILLTDGTNNYGEIDPVTSAQIAQMMGIHLYTVGLGKNDSVMIPVQTVFGIQNQKMLSKLDKVTLNEMSRLANGEFYEAPSYKELTSAFNKINFILKNKIATVNKKNTVAGNSKISYEMAIRVLNAIEADEYMILEKLGKDKDKSQMKKESEK
jgi:hypothetical protein